MNYIIIENHFWVPDNEIRANTRNKYWEDFSNIIHRIASIIYPNIEIEVLFLPPKNWSYNDIIKVVSKHQFATFNVIVAIWTISLLALTYIDSHEEHNHTEKWWVVDDTKKCLELEKMIEDIKKDWYDIENIPEEKLKEVCWDIKIKKSKNDAITTLKLDDMITNDEVILLNNKNQIIKKHNIQRKNFDRYIEYVPENEEFVKSNIEWIIEIISPVVKQKKEWKWIPWKWIYYWENIKEKWLDILRNWEEINFYMQDEDFKKKIYWQEVKFWSWDNISVTLSLKCDLKIDIVQNKKIYINEVKKVNADNIYYKWITEKMKVEKKKQLEEQIQTLF